MAGVFFVKPIADSGFSDPVVEKETFNKSNMELTPQKYHLSDVDEKPIGSDYNDEILNLDNGYTFYSPDKMSGKDLSNNVSLLSNKLFPDIYLNFDPEIEYLLDFPSDCSDSSVKLYRFYSGGSSIGFAVVNEFLNSGLDSKKFFSGDYSDNRDGFLYHTSEVSFGSNIMDLKKAKEFLEINHNMYDFQIIPVSVCGRKGFLDSIPYYRIENYREVFFLSLRGDVIYDKDVLVQDLLNEEILKSENEDINIARFSDDFDKLLTLAYASSDEKVVYELYIRILKDFLTDDNREYIDLLSNDIVQRFPESEYIKVAVCGYSEGC